VRKGGEQTNSNLVTTIAPKGKECSNEFLHTSTIIEKENHTRVRGGGVGGCVSLPLKVKELPRLVDIVTNVRNNPQSSYVTLEKDSNFMSKHLLFKPTNLKP
jgi:hypothetical protein